MGGQENAAPAIRGTTRPPAKPAARLDIKNSRRCMAPSLARSAELRAPKNASDPAPSPPCLRTLPRTLHRQLTAHHRHRLTAQPYPFARNLHPHFPAPRRGLIGQELVLAQTPLPVLAYVLERVLRLLHPFMPFVTEEVWQNLVSVLPEEPDRPEALIVAPYPEADESLIDQRAESEMGSVIEVIRAVRNLRAEFRIDASMNLRAAVDAPLLAPVLEAEAATIKSQAGIDPLMVGSDGDGASGGDSVALVLTGGTVTVPLGGMVDLDRERARLADELQQLKKNLGRLSTRLADEQFLSKAPEDVIERERQRLASGRDRSARIEDMLARLGRSQGS